MMASMREEVAAYRKDLIVRAASDAFFEHGYHDCTVDMIAERLSGTKAIVYYYFADKHAILEEIYARALAEAQALILQAMEEGGDAQEKLAAFARFYAAWVIDNQRVVGIFWREERSLSSDARAAVAREQKKIDDLVAQIIREGLAEGQFRVQDVQTTARAISGMISFTFTWWRNDRRLSRDEAAEFYARMALRIVGIAAG
jgi:AcrR family transcriptional regulator